MRFLAVISIWLIFVGGLSFYIYQRDSKIVTASTATAPQLLEDQSFTLELIPSFSTESDPFALDLDSSDSTLSLSLNGAPLRLPLQQLQRGTALSLPSLSGIRAGGNELFVSASTPLSESNINHALRIRLYRSAILLIDQTLWSEAGSKLSGAIHFDLSQGGQSHDAH